MYDFDQVKELLDLVAKSGVVELEVERNGFRLRIVGRQETVVAAPVAAPQAIAAPAPQAVTTPASESPREDTEAASDTPDEGLHRLTSPIVGTFYVASSPEADPFVRVGDRVSKGQVVCIVEAMKLMNEIESDVDGTVVEVLQENAQAVEFGQPLFTIRPD